ncbi:hypothetical protein [Roseiarcus sp.]|jgi:type II secretory pathway component PulC
MNEDQKITVVQKSAPKKSVSLSGIVAGNTALGSVRPNARGCRGRGRLVP